MTTPHPRMARPERNLDRHMAVYDSGLGLQPYPDGYRVVLQNADRPNA